MLASLFYTYRYSYLILTTAMLAIVWLYLLPYNELITRSERAHSSSTKVKELSTDTILWLCLLPQPLNYGYAYCLLCRAGAQAQHTLSSGTILTIAMLILCLILYAVLALLYLYNTYRYTYYCYACYRMWLYFWPYTN